MNNKLLKHSSILIFALFLTGCATYLDMNLKTYIIGKWAGQKSTSELVEYKMTFLPFNLLSVHITSGDETISKVLFKYRCVTTDKIDIIGRFTDGILVSRLDQDTITIKSTNGFIPETMYLREPPLVMEWCIVSICFIALVLFITLVFTKRKKQNKSIH